MYYFSKFLELADVPDCEQIIKEMVGRLKDYSL
jgi:hypothetical protein